jgi:Mrp family chromosome partitioning ATPase
MSRIYSALSGSAGRDDGGPALSGTVTAEEWAAAEEVPFVEVGGPTGTIFSAGPIPVGPVELATTPEPITNPEPPPAVRPFPRLAGTPTYLSVRFHDLTDTARPKPSADGPDADLVVLHYPDHPISGEYRVLRDEIRTQLPEPTPKVLVFTAAAPEAGTTTVLLNLAVAIAHEGGPRVLVVDAHVNRPAAARKLALKPAPGLAEVLALQVPLAWAVQSTAVPNLQVLAAGAATGETPKLLGEELVRLAGQLRQWYDWVLIDAGVWGTTPDRDSACPAADAVYLVSRELDVDRTEFAGLRGWVKELGGLLRGYITTRV